MRIDIHVHTTRYSDCGRSSPEEMVERAIDEGLEALVFTEHNVFWPAEELAALQARYPQILLLRGAEFTTSEGEDLLVYGPTDEDLIAIRRDGALLVRQVRARGGAIVLAHPYRFHPDVPPWLDEYPVDGIEIMSSNIYEHTSQQGRALARKLGLPVVASSDGHHVDSLGMYALDLYHPVHTEWELAQVLREGAFTLYVNTPRIEAQNALLEHQCDQIRRLVAMEYDDEEIRAAIPEFVSLTVIRGVRQGITMLRPARP